MIFTETEIEGVYIIEPEFLLDERGFFARTFCNEEFRDHGLGMEIAQCNISYNREMGTLRGMHYQAAPFGEKKIVSCEQGAIYDVVVDLRSESPTLFHWHSEFLSQASFRMLFIPEGCAHGFQTLEDNCIVSYKMGERYHPEYSRGIRWDDPSIGIIWPLPVSIVSEKDQSYPDIVP